MAAVTNEVLEEQMVGGLFGGIVMVLSDYTALVTQEANYDVKKMQKMHENWKMKDYKKNWPGGESGLNNWIIEVMDNFDIVKYYDMIWGPMQALLKKYAEKAFEIPIEEQTGDKGRNSMMWKMIPWLKKVYEYLLLTEQVCKE